MATQLWAIRWKGAWRSTAAGLHVIQFFCRCRCCCSCCSESQFSGLMRRPPSPTKKHLFCAGLCMRFSLLRAQNSISRLDVLCNASAFGQLGLGDGLSDWLTIWLMDKQTANVCKSDCEPVDMPAQASIWSQLHSGFNIKLNDFGQKLNCTKCSSCFSGQYSYLPLPFRPSDLPLCAKGICCNQREAAFTAISRGTCIPPATYGFFVSIFCYFAPLLNTLKH